MKRKIVPVEATPDQAAKGFIVSEAPHDPAGVYRAMIAAAPPYVVTDEDARAAWKTFHAKWPHDMKCMRAALEAFARRLGGES